MNGGRCVLCDAHVVPFSAPLEVIDLVAARAQLEADEAAARLELAKLDRDAALLSLAEFVRQGWHVLEGVELEWSWHHDALCQNVQGLLEEWLRVRRERTQAGRVARNKIRMRWQKLLINICPASLKSRIIMVFAVAWMWLRCPTWSVLCVSRNPANVNRDAEACRDLITSTWYTSTFGVTWKVRDDIDAKGKFKTTAGGERISKGLSSGFTGIHVDCHLLDDPDDAHEVQSEAERRHRAGKLESLSSRFNDKRYGVTILTQQRVHVDDATGVATEQGGWIVATYPLGMKAFTPCVTPFFTDPRTGAAGENLHADRFTPEVIHAAVLELGTAGFDAQYELNPAPAGGNLLKLAWFRYFRIAGVPVGGARRPGGDLAFAGEAKAVDVDRDGKLILDWLRISVDATFGSVSDTASAVSIQVIGGKAHERFVFHDDTKPRSFIDTCVDLVGHIAVWQTRVRCAIGVLVEKKANGAAVIEQLATQFSGLIPIEPEGGKEARASAISPEVESGCVYLLEGAEWLDAYLTGAESVTVFPHGKRDDRMDALSQCLNHQRADLDAVRLAAKNAALLSLRSRLGARAMFGG
jgi:predicted phage terminase large subunit-like protein